MISYPTIGLDKARPYDFLIVHAPKGNGMAAAVIIEVDGEKGLIYTNPKSGINNAVLSNAYLMEEGARRAGTGKEHSPLEALLVGLPKNFEPPMPESVVHIVGGVYIPREKQDLLPLLSNDSTYRMSVFDAQNYKVAARSQPVPK